MRRSLAVVLVATTALVAPASAWAQDDVASQASEDDATIVVTGSRVATNENSPTPLAILPAEEFLKLQPTTVTDALALMPAMMGSQGTSSRPGGGQRNGAAAYLSLRNMGDLRTLILMDGQRVIPTINSNQAQVDSSIVPQLLLERVDLVTGGVSAVYGSDGISGAINFVTDRNFEGLKFQANNGISTYGDAGSWDVGIAGGTSFLDGRLHIMGSYQHLQDDGLVDRRNAVDRDFYAANIGQAGNGSTANPFFNVPDMRISNATDGGLIISSTNTAIRGLQFTSANSLGAFTHGMIPIAGGTLVPFGTAGTLASANTESGGDGSFYGRSSIKHAQNFEQAFGRVDFDISDNVRIFAQLSWSNMITSNQFRSAAFISNNTTGNLRFSYANPFLWNVDTHGAAIRANPTGSLGMNILLQTAPTSITDTESYMFHSGLEGEIGDTWNWNFTVGRSRSEIEAIDPLNFQRSRLAAALDVVDVGQVTTGTANGQIACRVNVAYTGHAASTNPIFNGCVPLNIFGGEGTGSEAAYDWLYETTFNTNTTRLETAQAAISGEPFSTWAGPVRVALSAEARRLRWNVVSNADPAVNTADCTGILFNCSLTQTQWFNNSFAAIDPAKQTVKEAAIEAAVPLLSDVPFFQSLSVTGAYRYTDYSTSGTVSTWKLGVDWRLNDDLRFRATRSRDIRAPTLFETSSSIKQNCAVTAVDKLTNTTYVNLCNVERPNADLTPEIASTLTFGAVLTPGFIPGLTLSVDYYQIKVDDVILLQQGFQTNLLSTCADIQGNAPFCSLVSRTNWTDTNAATNPITSTRSLFFNIAQQDTWGIDFEGSYNADLFGRDLNLRAMVAYQPELTFDQGPSGILEFAGAYNVGTNRFGASPIWRVTGIVSYEVLEDFTVTWLQRWRSGLQANQSDTISVLQSQMPAAGYTTLNLNYTITDDSIGEADVFLNIRNLFDTFPTTYYSGQVSQPSSQPFLAEGDDTLGRYFTVGVRLRM